MADQLACIPLWQKLQVQTCIIMYYAVGVLFYVGAWLPEVMLCHTTQNDEASLCLSSYCVVYVGALKILWALMLQANVAY